MLETLPKTISASATPLRLAIAALAQAVCEARYLEIRSLAPHEIAWLDAYHKRVRDTLAPHLEGRALAWLVENTISLKQG